jgi:hypothetical protein
MKSKNIFFIWILILIVGCYQSQDDKLLVKNEPPQTVNAILGDESFIATYGLKPNSQTDEKIRIQTHLRYVKNILRKADVSSLNYQQQENRKKLLNLLHEYCEAGIFPKNYDYPNRRIPCFIDRDGNICAVGYLIEKTIGREIAEKINTRYQYEYVMNMQDEILEKWMTENGLTRKECAMIQPAYGYNPPPSYVTTEYGVSSSLLSGVNLSVGILNGIQIARGTNSLALPIVGLVSGAGQIVLGALNYPPTFDGLNGQYQNTDQRNLSLLNIGLGTSTMILSGWNLFKYIKNKNTKPKFTSWNVYGYPTHNNQVGIGFNFTTSLSQLYLKNMFNKRQKI